MSDDDEISELAALTDERERAFVLAILECESQTVAAEHAGYTGNRQVLANKGSQLMKKPRIRAAIQAVCRHHLGTKGILNAVKALENAAGDPSAKDHIKAASKLVDFCFPPTQRIQVEHLTSDVERYEAFCSIAAKLGKTLEDLVGPNRAHVWIETYGHRKPVIELQAETINDPPGEAQYPYELTPEQLAEL